MIKVITGLMLINVLAFGAYIPTKLDRGIQQVCNDIIYETDTEALSGIYMSRLG